MIRTSVDGKTAAAQSIINAADIKDKRSAKFARTDLMSTLETFAKKVKKYHTALISMDNEYESKFIKKEDLFAVIKAIEETIMKLEAIAVDVALKPPDVTVFKEVVKLQKISCPKFSGILQDFA